MKERIIFKLGLIKNKVQIKLEFEELVKNWNLLKSNVSNKGILLGTFYVKNIETIGDYTIFLAKDIENCCHLLIKVPDSFNIEEDDGTKVINIEEIELMNLDNEKNQYINIACTHNYYERDFLYYITELIHKVKQDPQRNINVAALRTLEEFEYTFAKKHPSIRSEGIIGLYGELYVLLKILEQNQFLLTSWKGWQGFKWDFLNNSLAFEIKTAIKTKIPKCKISSLDQLKQPDDGELFLIYIPLFKEEQRGLSFKEIKKKIESITSRPHQFNDILKKFGLNPEDESSYKQIESYAIKEDELKIYKVGENFPRITDNSFRDSLPDSIFNVSYSLDLINITVDYTSINDFIDVLKKFAEKTEE